MPSLLTYTNARPDRMTHYRPALIVCTLLCTLLAACNRESDRGSSFEPQLLDALEKIGLGRDTLVEPKVPYPVSTRARLPLVDKAMSDPPFMVGLSRQLLDQDSAESRGAYLIHLLHLLELKAAEPEAAAYAAVSMDMVVGQIQEVYGVIPETPPPNWLAETAPATALRLLIFEIIVAHKAWLDSGGNPTPEELSAIQQHIATTLMSRDTDPDPHRLLLDAYHSVGARQNLKALASAPVRLLAAIERSLPALQQAGPTELTGEWLTPMGKIKVAGTGDDTHTSEFALLIDPGGNDTYRDVAAAIEPGRISVVIDLAGDDTVNWDKVQGPGAGLLGIGLWLDLAGNDHYSGHNMGVGVGLLGAGLFWDTAGNDTYDAGTLSQGVGQYGLGILFDDHGNDHYTATLEAQGYGGPAGFGMLIDLEGDDTYACKDVFPDPTPKRAARHHEVHYLSMCQGYGFGLRENISGGVGLLMDRKGNDSYISDIFAQGAAYWFGLGMLVEGAGDDHYEAFEHAQGEGLHLSAGLLADWAGNDSYSGYEHVQGVGMDRAAGILYDNAGNDVYQSHRESQGAGLKSLGVGLLVDNAGNDTYTALTDSQGYSGRPEPGFPDSEWPTGILLDLGGTNIFDQPYADDVDSTGRIQNKQGIAINYGNKP
jgi:hypothetical protein